MPGQRSTTTCILEQVQGGPPRQIAALTGQTGDRAALTKVARRLGREFPEISPDDMNDVVLQVYAEFDACSIRDFVPLLVEKRIRRQLAGPDH